MRESGLTRAKQRSLPTSRRRAGHHGDVRIVSLFAAACTSPAGPRRQARPEQRRAPRPPLLPPR